MWAYGLTWFSADSAEQAQQYMDAVGAHATEIDTDITPVAWFLCWQHGAPVIVYFIGAADDDAVFARLKPLLLDWGCPMEQSLETVPHSIWQEGLDGIEAGLKSQGWDVAAAVIVRPDGVSRMP